MGRKLKLGIAVGGGLLLVAAVVFAILVGGSHGVVVREVDKNYPINWVAFSDGTHNEMYYRNRRPISSHGMGKLLHWVDTMAYRIGIGRPLKISSGQGMKGYLFVQVSFGKPPSNMVFATLIKPDGERERFSGATIDATNTEFTFFHTMQDDLVGCQMEIAPVGQETVIASLEFQ